MTINKKFLQLTGAFLILVFHLWIRLSSTMSRKLFRPYRVCWCRFIFSCFHCFFSTKRNQLSKEFIHNRIMTIYLPFVFFVLMNAFVQGKYTNIIRQIFFIEFFQKGGGAFLWFCPQ